MNNTNGYAVVLKGGSIGTISISNKTSLKKVKITKETRVFDTKEEAQDTVKRLNKFLTPGEKRYYGMRYIICEVQDNTFTGK